MIEIYKKASPLGLKDAKEKIRGHQAPRQEYIYTGQCASNASVDPDPTTLTLSYWDFPTASTFIRLRNGYTDVQLQEQTPKSLFGTGTYSTGVPSRVTLRIVANITEPYWVVFSEGGNNNPPFQQYCWYYLKDLQQPKLENTPLPIEVEIPKIVKPRK